MVASTLRLPAIFLGGKTPCTFRLQHLIEKCANKKTKDRAKKLDYRLRDTNSFFANELDEILIGVALSV